MGPPADLMDIARRKAFGSLMNVSAGRDAVVPNGGVAAHRPFNGGPGGRSVFFVVSMKRGAATQSASSASKSMRLDSLATHRVTKTGLCAILQSLHDQGLLKHRIHRGHVRREIQSHAKVDTPFGTVIKPLAIDGCTEKLEIIDPCALLWYLCTISPPFAQLIQTTLRKMFSVNISMSMFGEEN